MYWLVFNNQDGSVEKKCKSLESAERYVDKEYRSLQKAFGTGGRVCCPLSICEPGEEIVEYSSIPGHRVGSGSPNYVVRPIAND